MGESRHELLSWLNNLLQLNLTKVEQCGTGSALCQVFDSIFLDVPMSKVKFNVNAEYAYLNNFKILQNCFGKHSIDRVIPVEALVKCKMQDNLEFLQWAKRYWDQFFPGIDYDPVTRRKASGGPPSAPSPSASNSSYATSRAMHPSAHRSMQPSNHAAPRAPRPIPAASGGSALSQENKQLKDTVAGLERERDFYFNKLRDIELLMQQEVEVKPELEAEEGGLVGKMQAVLYSTEEGFEIPPEDDPIPVNGLTAVALNALNTDETF